MSEQQTIDQILQWADKLTAFILVVIALAAKVVRDSWYTKKEYQRLMDQLSKVQDELSTQTVINERLSDSLEKLTETLSILTAQGRRR